MSDGDLVPYAFARQRFTHACDALANERCDVRDRLLDAIVALSPLRAEDIPRSCQVLYERLQHLIGPELWGDDATSGTLVAAVNALSVGRMAVAIELLITASDTLDKHCGIDPGRRRVRRAGSPYAYSGPG